MYVILVVIKLFIKVLLLCVSSLECGIYGKEGKLAGPTQDFPVRVHGPTLILKTATAMV